MSSLDRRIIAALMIFPDWPMHPEWSVWRLGFSLFCALLFWLGICALWTKDARR